MSRTTAPIAASVVAFVAISTGLAACSDSTDTQANRTPRSGAADSIVAWARCMRAEGIDVPDPAIGSDGTVELPRSSAEESPERERAARKCRPVLSRGVEDDNSEADRNEAQEKLLAYARCMREHGIDMPDPQPPPEETKGPPVDVEDPRFQRAEEQCRRILFPNGDVPGR